MVYDGDVPWYTVRMSTLIYIKIMSCTIEQYILQYSNNNNLV